jgi:transposase-like protein
MEDYPRTILEFEQRFATEEACWEYLRQLRWPDGFRCPRCQCPKAWLTKRRLYHCTKCGLETSLIAGTIFQDTRKPLQLWFRAMWYVVGQKNGVSAAGLQRVLGLSRYETVWLWMHKLRTAMVRPGRDRLSGAVEVDETYIGGERPGKRGRKAAGKSLVFIAVEDKARRLGRIRLRRIPSAATSSLMPVVRENVAPGSTVRTDGWSGYQFLPGEGYLHQVVRQSAEVGENMLPLVNRVAALLKCWLAGTHQGAVRASHLDYYLDEYTFRFNRRNSRSRGKLFYRLVQQAATIPPVTARDIHGGKPLP